ncbi:hypothetical protein [Extibacter muris]|uniref:Uncharacterized protein n=1 Tax=Extibacter muris TaxID=1796622 RepID=A0A4R4FBQ7_9FIRM|nr:hypothetical protein [Extibacter muris]MCU0081383.1 hypothetical protein [Extibacter muris]TDA20109.1 hypothetical protein E1963_18860 [Extibacter muris]
MKIELERADKKRREKRLMKYYQQIEKQKRKGAVRMRTDKVFAESVVQNIQSYLPPELRAVECSVVETQKNNGVVLTGVTFKMPD